MNHDPENPQPAPVPVPVPPGQNSPRVDLGPPVAVSAALELEPQADDDGPDLGPAPDEEEAIDPVVEILGKRFELVIPESITMAYEIDAAFMESQVRALAAALGLCWPKLQRHVRYRYDPRPYGGRVLDYLLSKGASYDDVMLAGSVAFRLLRKQITTQRELRDAQVFSGAPRDPGSS